MKFSGKFVGKTKAGNNRFKFSKSVIDRANARGKARKVINRAVKSYVNRRIARTQETKIVSTQYAPTLFNSGISSIGDLVTVLPPVTLGTGQNNRIGNSIRPIKLVIRGYVSYYTSSSTLADARMLGARLMCWQDKSNRSYGNSSITNYQLINYGGTSQTFDGTVSRWLAPHNTDQMQWFCDKKMRIMKPFGYTNVGGTASATNAMTSMDHSLFHPFTITISAKHLPAVLKYDATESSNFPVNFAPYLALGYCDLLGAAADTVSTQLQLAFDATLYYKDA